MLAAEGRDPLRDVDTSPMGGASGGLDASAPDAVLLRVKSANHPIGQDLEFVANHSYSVLQVKETIQRLSAHHPEVKEQRLIYSGHLLEDTQTLKEVLRVKTGSQTMEPNQPVTFHLATTSKYIFPSSSTTPKTGLDNKGIGGGPPTAQQQPGMMMPPNEAQFQYQYQQQQQYMVNNGFYPVQGFQTPYTASPINFGGAGPGDMAALHSAYVQQMTAYMNQWYMSQGGYMYQMPMPYQFQPMASPMTEAQYLQNFQQYQNQVQAGQPAGPPQPVPAPRPQENDHVAAARVAENDEENQRDLLDWMYTFSRVILIFSVVYFYSSFSRFILVVLFTGLVMILQRRNNGGAGVEAHRAPPPPAAAAAGAQGQEGVGEQEGPAEEGGVQGDGSENSGTVEATPPPPPQRALSDIAWTFLTTFFTSLIPDNYQNNNNN